MIIKALNTFASVLDLSAMERLQEGNPCEHYPFRLFMRPGDVVTVDDKFYSLIRIQDALRLGYIEIGNLPSTPSSISLVDFTFTGTTVTMPAGEVLIAGDLVYYKSDGKVYRALADSTTTMICMGICASNSSNGSVVLLVDGMIRNSLRFAFTKGGQAGSAQAIVYVSETVAGDTTQTRSTTSGHIVQIIGYAVSPDILSFKPDYTYIEIK